MIWKSNTNDCSISASALLPKSIAHYEIIFSRDGVSPDLMAAYI
jgi:hypothetical protein